MSTSEALNVVNAFSSISSSVTFSLHNFNWKLILNNVELYSLTILKLATLSASSHIKLLGESQFFSGHISP